MKKNLFYLVLIILLLNVSCKSGTGLNNPEPKITDNNIDIISPDDITELTVTLKNNSVLLSWIKSSDSEKDLFEQCLYISKDGGWTWGSNYPDFNNSEFISIEKNISSYQVNQLINGIEYTFKISVRDEVPNESQGKTIKAVPKAE